MTVAVIQPSFASGELSPSLFGRVDLAKWHVGAATMRNFFVNYRGGASSRAGTRFVGASKQSGRAYPPRLIRFQFSLTQGILLEFGNLYVRFISNGGYILEATKNITAITNASPGVITSNAHGYSNNDLIFLNNIGGMTQLNGGTYTVANATANTFTLKDQFGANVDTTHFGVYTSGGTAARIYTLVSPYAEADLVAIKYTQSADVMSLTHPSYPPYDLRRLSSNSWTLTATAFGPSIAAPTGCAAATTTTSATPTIYQFVVTAIDSITGQESVASNIATVSNSANISVTAGSISVTWNPVAGAASYRVYQAPATYQTTPPAGTIFGYIGTALGNSFVNNNIIPDFTITPPLHLNPFAIGQILSVTMTNQGTLYAANPTITITTSTGSGAVLVPVVVGQKVQAVIVQDPGQNYVPADTITFSGPGGGGVTATGTLNIGPLTGTYPSCVAYFQERRVYANTNNNPDTYFMSQPGAFTNFDTSPIPLDDDAIIGTPWAQQVNGIQALVPVPTGLITLTGLGAWLVSGGNSAAITPTNQDARAQAYNGCHDHIQPIVANYDVLYVQAKGSIVRDLSFNLWVNIYTGTDISILSDHLFENHQLLDWAYAEEPFKVIWAIRDDGVMLSLTYLKEQEVQGWARHDTRGLFKSIAVVTENITTAFGSTFADVVYVAVQRLINGQWFYYIERMDPRIWNTLEDSWCLDAALSLTQPAPNATLTASQSSQPGLISNTATVVSGGAHYTSPTLTVVDTSGDGLGCVLAPVLASGVITSVTVIAQGSGYVSPQVMIQDSTGSGAVIELTIDNNITFTASSAVTWNTGDVIRMGGGFATITNVVSSTAATANLDEPITLVIPNDPNNTPVPAVPGSWTVTTPVTSVTGLSHLEGQTVKALADGDVIENLTVVGGTVPLGASASSVIVGIPFQGQIQSLYTDIPGEATIQGKRKNIFAVTVRVRDSRGLKVGSNQVDASTQPLGANVEWANLIEIKERSNSVFAGTPIPLFTGDERVNIPATWRKPGQVAVQQDNPLPANVLAFIPEIVIGDSNG